MELNEIDNLSEIEDKYYDALDWGKNLKSILDELYYLGECCREDGERELMDKVYDAQSAVEDVIEEYNKAKSEWGR